ncbi:hypothetical protein JOM56_002049 [Amanita muscaria]
MTARKLPRRVAKTIMKSHKFLISRDGVPIRLRPWFILFAFIDMATLAFLGFTNFSRALPINDKVLHFLCFAVVTAIFYFILDVEEEARRVWFWRHLAVIFTIFICLFCGAILSEIVQSFLPYKQFDINDIFANLLGSLTGLFVAHYIDRYHRYRREIARLYRPLDTATPFSDDEDEGTGTQLLPTHTRGTIPSHKRGTSSIRLADPWDEREELFGVGGDSDLEDESQTHTQAQKNSDGVPRITITDV